MRPYLGDMVQPGTYTRYEAGDCLLGGNRSHTDYGVRSHQSQYPVQGTAQVSGPMHSRYDGTPRLWSRPQSRTPRPGVPATGDGWLEPDPPAKAVERSGKQEERAALWAALGLPPHERR